MLHEKMKGKKRQLRMKIVKGKKKNSGKKNPHKAILNLSSENKKPLKEITSKL